MARSKSWIFTLNNPESTPEDYLVLMEGKNDLTYMIFQQEVGENGTPHYQGYVETRINKRLNQMRSTYDARAHWEPRRGSQQQAIDYCSKEETRVAGPWQCGEKRITAQGRRNDIVAFKDAIQSGMNMRDLIDTFTVQVARFPKFYTTVRQCTMPERENELIVRLNFGPTGAGKTRYAYDNYDGDTMFVMPLQNGTLWFDGYDGHTVVLLDDFAGRMSKVPLDFTLRVLDRYPVQVPIKGGFRWWLPNEIIITSNFHPRQWYTWDGREQQYAALMRRITVVYRYSNDIDPEEIDLDLFRDDHYDYYL